MLCKFRTIVLVFGSFLFTMRASGQSIHLEWVKPLHNSSGAVIAIDSGIRGEVETALGKLWKRGSSASPIKTTDEQIVSDSNLYDPHALLVQHRS